VRVLVVNTGSSTLKLSVVDGEDRVTGSRLIDPWDGRDLDALSDFVQGAGGVGVVGHRIVHGGPRYRGSVEIDDSVLGYLESITELAPLHNPRAVAAARAFRTFLPGVPAVAVFDTAFHSTMPAAATTYALPRSWNAAYGLRRYGFHGISHSYAARRAAEIVGEPLSALRVVTCHLGAGASLCAVHEGRSVDTTMGFTPLAGLVMQTRSGSIDPGLLLWLLGQEDLDREGVSRVLERESGLRGLTGTSGDLREVLEARRGGDPDAVLGFDVFVHRLTREIGAMVVGAGGLDVLVFTGGMGEHSPEIRSAAAGKLEFLGVRLDDERNTRNHAGDISAGGALVRTLIVPTAEDVEIARQARTLVG
jgi:acetate kinase